EIHQFARNRWKLIELAARVPRLDRYVPAFDIADVLQPSEERAVKRVGTRRATPHNADSRQPLALLLRACSRRPCRRTTDADDKITSRELIKLHPIPRGSGLRKEGYPIMSD